MSVPMNLDILVDAGGASSAAATISNNIIPVNAFTSPVVYLEGTTVDCSKSTYFKRRMFGAGTWVADNVPTGAYSFILELSNGGLGVQTWFSGITWAGGSAPTLTASGVDVIGFLTDNGGNVWRGFLLSKNNL